MKSGVPGPKASVQMSPETMIRTSSPFDSFDLRNTKYQNMDTQPKEEMSLNYSISHMSRVPNQLIKSRSKPNRLDSSGLEAKLSKFESTLRKFRLEAEESNILYMYDEFSHSLNKGPQTQITDQARGSGQETLFLGLRSEDQKSESDIYEEYIPSQQTQLPNMVGEQKVLNQIRKSQNTVTKSENISRSSVSVDIRESADIARVPVVEEKPTKPKETGNTEQLQQSQVSSTGRSFQHQELGDAAGFGEDLFDDDVDAEDDITKDLIGRQSFANLISDTFDYQAQNRSDDDLRVSSAYRRYED